MAYEHESTQKIGAHNPIGARILHNPDGGVEKFGYLGNFAGPVAYTNQTGSQIILSAYNALERKTNEIYKGVATNSFAFDPAGNLIRVTDGNGKNTTWTYDGESRVTAKKDHAGVNLFTYGYFGTGWLSNRVDALGKNTKYSYDGIGNLTGVDYPASRDLQLSYDAAGRLTNMISAAGTNTFGYTAFGALSSEGGLWPSDTVSYTFNSARRRSSLSIKQPLTLARTHNYYYDAAGRLYSNSTPAGPFVYTFKGAGNLATNLSLPNSAVIASAYDTVGRLTGTWLKNSSGTILNGHTYGYNAASERITVTNTPAGNHWAYGYDGIGQLKTAAGKEPGGANRVHEQLGYVYDAGGNLTSRTNNGLVYSFAPNQLNQITNASRVSGNLTVAGMTASGMLPVLSVSVNGAAATRYSDKTYALGGFTNFSGTYTAIAMDFISRKDTNTVTVNLPSSINFAYDQNGNLTNDAARIFSYDDENQLIGITVSNSWRSDFTYDGFGRMRVRTEAAWNGSGWITNTTVRYLYDGMAVVQERDGSNQPTVSYLRGLDLSASLQGAGGIGGLLARYDHASALSAFYHADGGGNVTALMTTAQTLAARYVYDPFGRIVAQSGPLADANVYRFSSKEFHANSGLYSYGFRWYDPNLQRWINRDPMGETFDVNLYRFAYNNPNKYVDPNGLWGISFGTDDGHEYFGFGVGDPTFWFTRDSLNDVKQGAAATADGFIPVLDPFQDVFDVYNSDCDKVFKGSQFFGGLSRDVATLAVGGALGTVLKSTGGKATFADRLILAEIGPSWTSLLTSKNPLNPTKLLIDYAGKWAGRVDTGMGFYEWLLED